MNQTYTLALTLAFSFCTLCVCVMEAAMTFRNRRLIEEVHTKLDGRLTELIARSKESSHAAGRIEGIQKEVSDAKKRHEGD